MPTAMTYQSLLQDLQFYLERGTSVDPQVYAELPVLINAAEREIATRLKILGFVNNVNGNFSAGQPVYAKPNGWRETISLNFGTDEGLVIDNSGQLVIDSARQNLASSSLAPGNARNPIYPRSYEFCRAYWPDDSKVGVPLYYAEYNYNWWLIVPTPQAAFPFEVNYYQQPQLLDAINNTNWLTIYQPTTLRYRALMECEPFLRNDPRLATWEKMYETSVAAITKQDIQMMIDRGAQRERE